MQKNNEESVNNIINNYFHDRHIAKYVIKQVNQLPDNSFTITNKYDKLIIHLTVQIKHATTKTQKSIKFMIDIHRNFPLDGIRLYLVQGPYQPQVFDCRDLLQDCLGQKWNHQKRIIDIYNHIDQYLQKIQWRNENYLSMQKTGQFKILDNFYYQELVERFPSLNLFIDNSSEQLKIIGISQTHYLKFKESKIQANKKISIKKNKKVFLAEACDMQCIFRINYNQQFGQIVLTINKYHSIKSFNQFVPSTHNYLFDDPEYFLRTILKNIPKFQELKISFYPKFQNQQTPIASKLHQTHDYETILFGPEINQLSKEQKEQLISRLQKNYQKLIEYFSARALAYYLIFVNKLNYIYSKYIVSPPQEK